MSHEHTGHGSWVHGSWVMGHGSWGHGSWVMGHGDTGHGSCTAIHVVSALVGARYIVPWVRAPGTCPSGSTELVCPRHVPIRFHGIGLPPAHAHPKWLPPPGCVPPIPHHRSDRYSAISAASETNNQSTTHPIEGGSPSKTG